MEAGRTQRRGSRSNRTGRRTSFAPRRRRFVAGSDWAIGWLRWKQRPRTVSVGPSTWTPCSLRSHPSSEPSWRRKSMAEWVPEWVPRKNRRDPLESRRLQLVPVSELPKSGRWDSNPRRPAWEGGGKTSAECSTRQFSSEDATLGATFAMHFSPNSAPNGSRNGSHVATYQRSSLLPAGVSLRYGQISVRLHLLDRLAELCQLHDDPSGPRR